MTGLDAPADPPGLDAAIEAARRTWENHATVSSKPSQWVCICGATGVKTGLSPKEHLADSVGHVVRAAAPALRAGALREAADEARYSELIGGFIWAGWLRERADQIGGAT